jgi:hypothetical protein
MDTTVLLIIIFIGIALAVGISWLLYKAGFSVKTIKAKAPMLEVEAERKGEEPESDATPPAFSQEASDGGELSDVRIKGKKGSSARQAAHGKDSRIEKGRIEIE